MIAFSRFQKRLHVGNKSNLRYFFRHSKTKPYSHVNKLSSFNQSWHHKQQTRNHTTVAEFFGKPIHTDIFEALQLKTFTDEEIDAAFDKLDADHSGTISKDEICRVFEGKVKYQHLQDLEETNKEDFKKHIKLMGEKLDSRIYPMAFSLFLCGLTIGMLNPMTPLLIQKLGISAAEFGVVVACFGFSKLIGNIPFSVAVDIWGRKPFLVSTMGLIALGVGGTGACQFMHQMALCRLMTGFGVSGLITASQMYSVDISTPLNRSRTLAPTFAAFSGGAALGPALGGILCGHIGLENCFYFVGTTFLAGMALNQAIFTETLPISARKKPHALREVVNNTSKDWKEIFKNKKARQLLLLNTGYWVGVSGAQMTILPLLLTNDTFQFEPAQIGYCFALLSFINVLFSQPFATMADKYGRTPIMCLGTTSMATGVALTSICETGTTLGCALVIWGIGYTMLAAIPAAYMQDIVTTNQRTQALGLLRMVGDVGLIAGALTGGKLADVVSMDVALQANAALLFCVGGWFGIRINQITKAAGKI